MYKRDNKLCRSGQETILFIQHECSDQDMLSIATISLNLDNLYKLAYFSVTSDINNKKQRIVYVGNQEKVVNPSKIYRYIKNSYG